MKVVQLAIIASSLFSATFSAQAGITKSEPKEIVKHFDTAYDLEPVCASLAQQVANVKCREQNKNDPRVQNKEIKLEDIYFDYMSGSCRYTDDNHMSDASSINAVYDSVYDACLDEPLNNSGHTNPGIKAQPIGDSKI